MTRTLRILLLCALASPLAAQADLKLAVGFPSSTVIYLEIASPDILDNLGQNQFLEGMIPGFKTPDLTALLSEKIGLRLTKEELKGLVTGVRRGAVGLLDVAVSGPRLQLVVDHKDPSALERALKAASADSPGVQLADTYEKLAIYSIDLPAGGGDSQPGGLRLSSPVKNWLTKLDKIFIGVHGGRYLLVASTLNAVKDAHDFMSFPDDTTDTLLGNARYREALAEFEKPQGLLFINTNSLIQAIERIIGDQGKGPAPKQLEMAQFFINLIEYKQLKSFAAGYWVDDAKQTVRMDARLQFHFAPGWYDAVRTGPGVQALADYIPGDVIFAFTNNLERPADVFAKGRAFALERAKEAGRNEVAKAIEDFDIQFRRDGVNFKDLLAQFSGGMAFIVVPGAGADAPGNAFVMRMKDKEKCQEFFFENVIGRPAGSDMRRNDRNIEIFEGYEIHFRNARESRTAGFAFVDDVMLTGDLGAMKAVITARKEKRTLAQSPTFAQARGAVWEKSSGTVILNYGAMVRALGEFRFFFIRGEEAKPVVEDCTAADDKPAHHLSEFFSQTIVVIGSLGKDKEISLRYCAARWPTREQFRNLATHFRDVARNKQVRDRLSDLLRASTTHYALKGKAPAKAAELAEQGYLQKADSILDPYGDEASPRHFKIAPQAADADIRQPILLAYQEKPGLRGRHMAVLWTGDVVSLTNAELADAIERAAKGEPVKGREKKPALTDPKTTMPGDRGDRWDKGGKK